MSATTAGALKALLESGGFGIPFYRDRAPKDQGLPFGVITEAIAVTPAKMGDLGDPAADLFVDEMVQVSIYETWRGPDGRVTENYMLASGVFRLLRGARLTTPHPGVVIVTGYRRVPDVAGTAPDTAGLGSVPTGDRGANVVATHFTGMVRRQAG